MNPPIGSLKLLIAIILLAVAWTFDPVAWRVRWRFSNVSVTDCQDYGWLLPGFLHSHWTSATDLYDGTYLSIELSDQSVDLSQFLDVPFFLLVLNHCKVSDLAPTDAMHLGNRGIIFRDCDLRGVPPSRLGAVRDAQHVSFSIGGP